MVKHRLDGTEWWCLPGGVVEAAETPLMAAVRELAEECCVTGRVIRQTSHVVDDMGLDTITFLMDIGAQEPHMGADPEFTHDQQILAEIAWLTLAHIPERDRAYLWAAGLLSVPPFTDEVSDWGDELSYPAY
ncbi:MAG: hypothetical protein A2136_07170 [Chloroflexi bacterium RBG_16_54_11]|nr:MAG: hypothetical protein A2136_07170 [Chloroflexi bacterium RBG_16_54_11]